MRMSVRAHMLTKSYRRLLAISEVGREASGTIYKGVIVSSQKPVVVKRLEKVAAEGEKEFQTKMKVIEGTHHKNLVHLLGYCLDGPKKLLVYEYMSNGSLADVLFTPERQLVWEARMGIARNIARGFFQECDTQIIHCDIKPQNILMDEYMHYYILLFARRTKIRRAKYTSATEKNIRRSNQGKLARPKVSSRKKT
ncbi:hypothetical protein L3X38_033137 [Prunus dulcis]|uniref:Protein kinase domain-containing protein n=1 Tax=Prunus dulcis TaxID=3755 RepID=A0AAD4VGS5_PRUDU|nr:hypothetical protein L3X38_033137 [Prunus dulcis]